MSVDRESLEAAWREGAKTVEELSYATGAGTGCGTCRIDLIKLLRELQDREQDHAPPR